MRLAEKFSRNLYTIRTRRRLTQQGLAAKAGVSVSYISMLERVQRSPPLETIDVLARALSVKPLDLLQ